MPGLRQNADSRAGMQNPRNGGVEKNSKKFLKNPKVPKTGADNDLDPRQSGRKNASGAP
jgi:hypothetical protein